MRGVTLAAALAFGGCAGSPATHFDAAAAQLGLVRSAIDGAGHTLRVFETAQGMPDAGRLHVYLDGDGRPFVRPGRIARDPTPQDPLTLHLLAADDHPAVYLGRPCYHAAPGPCDPSLWSVARYGEVVVASLVEGVRILAARHPHARLVLIGYSGGGALAMLVAARVPEVSAVVTIAANLDTPAWTDHHGYSPLTGSFDPARHLDLTRVPRSLHFSGARDRQVPPELQASFAARTPGAEFRQVAEFDHRCCWVSAWPAMLREIDHWLQAATADPRPVRRAPSPASDDYPENRPST